MLRLLAQSAVQPADSGEIRFMPTRRLAEVEFSPQTEIRRLSAEQSNSSLIVDDKAVLKLIRRLSPGTIPRRK